MAHYGNPGNHGKKPRYGRDPFPADDAQSYVGGDAAHAGYETLKRAPRSAGHVLRESQGWIDPERSLEKEKSDRMYADWMDRNDY